MCENLHYESTGADGIDIFQRASQRAGILLTDNIQSGGSYNVNYY